jgi:hypothetical protein
MENFQSEPINLTSGKIQVENGVDFYRPSFKFKRIALIIPQREVSNCLIFFKIRPSLTTSKEGMKTIKILEGHNVQFPM